MVEHTLSSCCNAAKQLLRAGRYDDAIKLCQGLLELYPKHVPAYTIMGEAYLAKGDHAEAANLFRQALGGDPEDTIAYAGLGLIYEERGLLEEAIWQLERAFELAPYNREIRASLLDFSTQLDASAPDRLKLNRAAMARIFTRGHLYSRATRELRDTLRKEPLRVDLRVALAEALWRDGRYESAAVVCEGILELAPNCLKANLILGEIWLRQKEREARGRALLDQAQTLDPENVVARTLFGDRSPLAPRKVIVPQDILKGIPLPETQTLSLESLKSAVAEIQTGALDVDLPMADILAPLEELAEAMAEEPASGAPPVDIPSATPFEGILPDVGIQAEDISLPGVVAPDDWAPMTEETSDYFVAPPEEQAPGIERLRREVMSNPDDHVARLQLARAYHRKGETARALEEYAPISAATSGILGEVIADLEDLTARDIENEAAREMLAKAYAEGGRVDDALALYRRLYSELKTHSHEASPTHKQSTSQEAN